MKILSTAKGYKNSIMTMEADVGGDYLPSEIIIRHNGEYHSYRLDGDER